MVAQIRVHEHDELPPGVLQAKLVRRAQSQLSRAGEETDAVGAVRLLQPADDVLRAVGRGVVDDQDLVVWLRSGRAGGEVVVERLHQQPADDGNVFPLVIRGQDNGYLRHTHVQRRGS